MRKLKQWLPQGWRQRSESGQALVEMAVVLPIIIALLCGTMEFGWMCFNQINIANMAREGAREGIIYSAGSVDLNSLTTEMVEKAPDSIKDKLTVNMYFSNVSNPREGDVIVNIAYRASAITPILGIVTSRNEYELNANCTMKVE
ncbi:MAG: TadE family protein [Anaerovoracaceae bacterium]